MVGSTGIEGVASAHSAAVKGVGMRRTVLVITLTSALCAGIAWSGSAGAVPADACSLTTHCYAVIRWHPTPSLHGIKEYNLTNCLNGTAPNFANSEEWIGNNDVAWGSASLTWVEEGIKDGGGVN